MNTRYHIASSYFILFYNIYKPVLDFRDFFFYTIEVSLFPQITFSQENGPGEQDVLNTIQSVEQSKLGVIAVLMLKSTFPVNGYSH
jgi:hypothetical protein